MITDAKHRLIALTAATLVAAAPALAQDNTAEQPASDAPTETTTTDAAPAANGEAAPADDGLGRSYVKEVSGDWQIICVKTQLEADPCRLFQLLKDQSGGSVATMEVVPIPGQPGAAGVTIATPLATFLKAPLEMTVDGGAAAKFAYEFCTQENCVVREGVRPDMVERFQRGAKAQLSIVPNQARDQKVIIDVSLAGFTAGFKAVTDFNAAAAEAYEKAVAAQQGQSGN